MGIGIFALVYGGITMTTREEMVDLGPVQVVQEEEHTLPLPPIVGGVLLVAGVLLLRGRSDRRHNGLSGRPGVGRWLKST